MVAVWISICMCLKYLRDVSILSGIKKVFKIGFVAVNFVDDDFIFSAEVPVKVAHATFSDTSIVP